MHSRLAHSILFAVSLFSTFALPLSAQQEPPLEKLHPEDRAAVELILQHRGSRGKIGLQDVQGKNAVWVDDGGYKNTIGFVFNEKTGRITQIHGNGQWLDNDALRALAVCKELEMISCQHNPRGMMKIVDNYSGEGLAALTALPIYHVSFSGAFDDRGMKAAAKIPTLRQIHARQTEVGDAGVAAFEGHPKIEDLVIDSWSRPQFTVASLRSLSKMPSLKSFTFFGTYLTWENGFDQLAPMAGQIQEIKLPNTLILPEDYEKVKSAFPKLTWPIIDYAKLLGTPRLKQNWLKYADKRGVAFIQSQSAL